MEIVKQIKKQMIRSITGSEHTPKDHCLQCDYSGVCSLSPHPKKRQKILLTYKWRSWEQELYILTKQSLQKRKKQTPVDHCLQCDYSGVVLPSLNAIPALIEYQLKCNTSLNAIPA